MNISGFTTDDKVSKGPVAQNDFKIFGKIELTFHVNYKMGIIGVSVAGFESFQRFYLKPTKKQENSNAEFYKRFVLNFSKKEEFDAIIK